MSEHQGQGFNSMDSSSFIPGQSPLENDSYDPPNINASNIPTTSFHREQTAEHLLSPGPPSTQNNAHQGRNFQGLNENNKATNI